MNLLEFIRKRILSNKAKLFDQNVKPLTAHLLKGLVSGDGDLDNLQFSVEQNWDVKKHDKALLRAYSDHGFKNFVIEFNQA